MQPVVTAAQMREIDRLTTEKYGIPSLLLMENAAHAAARVIIEKLGGSVVGKSFLILCGKGNNGGDGAALARLLAVRGAHIELMLFGKVKETKGDAKVNFEICRKLAQATSAFVATSYPDIFKDSNFFESGGSISFHEVSSRKSFDKLFYGELSQDWDAMVDAVFGTGLSRPLEIWLGNVIHHLNILNDSQINYFGRKRLRVSLDLPSGLNADLSHSIGTTFQADLTVTFTAPKPANVFPTSDGFNGELVIADIGSPQSLIVDCQTNLFVAERQDAQDWLTGTLVKPDSYKKTRGTALIIGGSENYSGAVTLAANACFASGAGMVTAAVPKAIKSLVAAKLADEIILKTLESVALNKEQVEVIALGCGMANDVATRKFIRETVKKRTTPLVLDAEALNALAPFKLQGTPELPLVLTPHIGEFKRLLGNDEEITDKISAAREFAVKHQVILVLKGERSLIAAPDGRVIINPTGNAGIARAGAGDTLTGIITGCIAQTLATPQVKNEIWSNAARCLDRVLEAVVAALYLAGVAGDIAAEKFGQRMISATDIRNCFGEALQFVQQ